MRYPHIFPGSAKEGAPVAPDHGAGHGRDASTPISRNKHKTAAPGEPSPIAPSPTSPPALGALPLLMILAGCQGGRQGEHGFVDNRRLVDFHRCSRTITTPIASRPHRTAPPTCPRNLVRARGTLARTS